MRQLLIILTGVIIIFTACRKKTDNHANDEQNVKLLLTAYSEHFEVFAEADPFIVGSPSAIMAHFTYLTNFKPLVDAEVTLSLITGKQGVRQTLKEPDRPGIYIFEIEPVAEGLSYLVFNIYIGDEEYSITVNDIDVFIDIEKANEAARANVPSGVNAFSFTKETSWKIDFATENPKMEPFGSVIATTARVESAPDDEMIVSAKAAGIVLFNSSYLLEGQLLKSGQLLFSVAANELVDNNSRVRYDKAQSDYDKASADYERAKSLAESKIVSEKSLLEAKHTFDNAKSIFDNLVRTFNGNGQRIYSPMSGYAKHIWVRHGQYVETGDPLISVSKNKDLMLKADLPQKHYQSLASIYSANITVASTGKTFTLEELNGKVLSWGRSSEDHGFLIPVFFRIDNKEGFLPGSFVEMFIKCNTNSNALTIPNTSLVEEQGAYFVFVQITPELFEKREVKIGATDNIRTEIVSGITENDRVVTRGAILVKLAAVSNSLDPHAGHVH